MIEANEQLSSQPQTHMINSDYPADQIPAILASATDKALEAIVQFNGADVVGEHLGVDYQDSTAALHRFNAHVPGYQGWQWVVVVAAVPGSHHVTISEVVLTPGPDALLAPQWIPWKQRIQPGDLAPGDLLAPNDDDYRLVPGYTSTGDQELDEIAGELGLGKRWLLSPIGRLEAAQRWHSGPYGPSSAMARAAKRLCRDCGFFIPLTGSLGRVFGACANALAADGRVVDGEYGCGAHSETPPPPPLGSPAFTPFDDEILDIIEFTVNN